MTSDLATISTGAANPGSFYGRAGAGPRGARDAAHGAERATHALRGVIDGAGPDIPPPACLYPAGRILRASRTLATCLALEAGIAATALTPDLAIPEPVAAGQARAHLLQAARRAKEAGSGTSGAWRVLRQLAREHDTGAAAAPDLAKAAGRAETAAAALDDQLRHAHRQPIPAALPMIAGHATITNYLALALVDLSGSCSGIAAILEHAAPGAARAADPMRETGQGFMDSANAALRACHVLHEAAAIIRKAPPGFPCASCGGTTISRLTRSACNSCRGSGIDVRAMRPVTDY